MTEATLVWSEQPLLRPGAGFDLVCWGSPVRGHLQKPASSSGLLPSLEAEFSVRNIGTLYEIRRKNCTLSFLKI